LRVLFVVEVSTKQPVDHEISSDAEKLSIRGMEILVKVSLTLTKVPVIKLAIPLVVMFHDICRNIHTSLRLPSNIDVKILVNFIGKLPIFIIIVIWYA
jgi:hypothetical protein